MPATQSLAENTSTGKKTISFLLDTNFGLPTDKEPWNKILKDLNITTDGSSNDLVMIDAEIAAHRPDLAYIPIADFHRLLRKGDTYYRGFVIGTSKFTGSTDLPSVLVVRQDDPATGLDSLEGATYGYINKSCSSSYFPPAILLQKQGKKLDQFLKIKPVKPWQGQIDAVVAKEVRATLVPEDVWKTTPENAQTTKVIGRYDTAKPGLIVVRQDFDEKVGKTLLDALVAWAPKWEGVYGPFKPYYLADVFSFYHDLDQLPADF
jgi:phosphonate transport system substrate-binding protein